MKYILLTLSMVVLISACQKNVPLNIKSPDGKITTTLSFDENASLTYGISIDVNGSQVTALEPSKLGLVRNDEAFTEGLKLIKKSAVTPISDSYQLSSGKKKDISYVANEVKYDFQNNNEEKISIRFRAFNDGLAYRYEFPDQKEGSFTAVKELSEFNLPDEGNCWSQAYDTITQYTPAYETYYERKMPIGTQSPTGKNGWSFPITFNVNNLWILITEANLNGTYPGSHLQADCAKGVYTVRWPEASECFGEYSNTGDISLPWASPWRLVVLGQTPATIVENTLVTDLSEPSKIEDTSWIIPGRASWSWWSNSDSPQLVKEQKRFSDFAAEMGWEYNLIDANWNNMKDGDVREAIDYANEKGIGSILWYNSGGKHNKVEEAPRDKMWDPEIRANEFKMLADWGVKGVKVDFFQSDKQDIINQYLGILKDAAENKIMVNFHGCTLPRGWNRTWPNMVSLEAVPGGEVYKFGKDYPEVAPWHNTILPFTRNAVGPMDYTPVMFTEHHYPHLTTFAHELATSVAFESGIIHFADEVEMYKAQPEAVIQFLKDIPASWDEIKFIDGYPGDFVILARRSADTWYVAALNGNKKSEVFTLSTDFLGEGSFHVKLIMDGASSKEFSFNEKSIKAGEKIEIPVLPYGGFSATIAAE